MLSFLRSLRQTLVRFAHFHGFESDNNTNTKAGAEAGSYIGAPLAMKVKHYFLENYKIVHHQ